MTSVSFVTFTDAVIMGKVCSNCQTETGNATKTCKQCHQPFQLKQGLTEARSHRYHPYAAPAKERPGTKAKPNAPRARPVSPIAASDEQYTAGGYVDDDLQPDLGAMRGPSDMLGATSHQQYHTATQPRVGLTQAATAVPADQLYKQMHQLVRLHQDTATGTTVFLVPDFTESNGELALKVR